MALLLGNQCCEGNCFVPRWGGFLMLAPEYEVDVITHNGVMAHFTCIPYYLDYNAHNFRFKVVV